MKLFTPGKIGKLVTRNRIIMAPMGIGALAEPDGRLSQRAIEYYAARAKGGVGLIITGIVCVEHEIEEKTEEGFGIFCRADAPFHINGFSELADAVHDYGAVLCVQLSAGVGRVAFGDILRKGRAVGPSELPCFWNPRVKTRALTTEEVEALVQAFGRAALFLRMAGVDAIELHGHEGYLLDQFQSSLWNKRTDKYGGDLEGRLRFPLEVVETIKSAVGKDFPLIYRYGLVHHVEGGRGTEESLEMARRFEKAGVDALHVDAGCYETWYWAHPPTYQPPGCMVEMARMVKQVVDIPVIAVGKLGYPALAEQVLEKGKADFIALGRSLLADPEWPKKVKENRMEDICPCIGDHTGCLDRIFRGKYLSCTVNPEAGMEKSFAVKRTEKPKSVLVIGGGPAGMEAALVAAKRGHAVQLWEKTDKFGGMLIPGSVPAFKRDLQDLVTYLSGQVRKMAIDIRLEMEATASSVLDVGAQVVIVATGSRPILPDLPGIQSEKVCSAIDLLLGRAQIGEYILVVGGGLLGCEVAVHLAQEGKQVTVVEILDRIFRGENRANQQQMLKMISDFQVRILTETQVREITDEGVLVGPVDKLEFLKTDTVVISVGLQSQSRIRQDLEGQVPELYAIGDCVAPRKIINAIWEGFRTGRLI